MKKIICIALLAGALAGCTFPRSQLGPSLVKETVEPVLVTGNTGSRAGYACGRNIAGIYSMGDMSVQAAKKNGHINKVSSVDAIVKNYVVFAEVCTVVTGE